MSDLQPIGGGSYVPPAAPTPPPAPPAPMPDTIASATGYRPAPLSAAPPRRQAEDPDNPPAYLYGIGGVAALALLGWGGSFLLPSAPVDAPAAYVPFAAADNSFTCELPDKWRVEPQGRASKENRNSIADGVEARQSDACIEVTTSTIAGLLTGQLLYGSGPVPDGLLNSRARPVFNDHGRAFKKRFKGYKETKLTPTNSQLPPMTNLVLVENTRDMVPDIRLAEFTASGNKYGIGGKRHGYRMAVGGNAEIVNVVCECSERDWTKLKPAFEKVMVSMAEPRRAGMPGVAVPGGGAPLPTGGVPGFGGQ